MENEREMKDEEMLITIITSTSLISLGIDKQPFVSAIRLG
jgi:hypothetical protein